jgi:hypothetical protein
MYLPPYDKTLHVVAGSIAAIAGLLVCWQAAAICCVSAAVTREAFNRHQGGEFDWHDIAATLAGGVLVLSASAVGVDGIQLQGL